MKRGIIIAVAAISMAGAASASIFTTLPESAAATRSLASPQGVAPEATPPAGKPPPALQARLAEPPAEPTAKPAPAALDRKGAVTARQKPVPLQVAPRPPVRLPAADITEAYAAGEASPSITASISRTDDPGENAARAAIEADGYKGVQVVRKGDNGVWHAKAMRGRTEVRLVVDATGSVMTAD